ncbi:MAG: hypothetical protein MZW92_43070 [Comamonadaceae bacterium]|nr:hypothetical protein [Comamonadaceae bacterium]
MPLWLYPTLQGAGLPQRRDRRTSRWPSERRRTQRRARAASGAPRRARRGARQDKNGFLMMFRAESLLVLGRVHQASTAPPTTIRIPTPRNAARRPGRAGAGARRRDAPPPRVQASTSTCPRPPRTTCRSARASCCPNGTYRKRLLRAGPLPRAAAAWRATRRPGAAAAAPARSRRSKLRRQFAALAAGAALAQEPARRRRSSTSTPACAPMPTASPAATAARPAPISRSCAARARPRLPGAGRPVAVHRRLGLATMHRVIDVIRDSAAAVRRGADRHRRRASRCYGFSSLQAQQRALPPAQGLRRDATTPPRAAASPRIKPGYYTRMGAAIRHATRLLDDAAGAARACC